MIIIIKMNNIYIAPFPTVTKHNNMKITTTNEMQKKKIDG